MIRYDIKCANGHGFDAWFANSAAFDEQADRGLVSCPICGTVDVTKALMVPGIPAKANRSSASAPEPAPAPPAAGAMMSGPVPQEVQNRLAELRREVEANATDVGADFASEARKIHVGESEPRAIYGQASGDEAKSLIDDGIPVAPLPFFPKRDD